MAYIALIMVIIKILLAFFAFVIKKANYYSSEHLNSDEASCVFCQKKDNSDFCTNVLFKWKLKKNICPREKCWGFNTGQAKIDENVAFVNVPWLLTVKKVVDLFPELAAALLALNEILSK